MFFLFLFFFALCFSPPIIMFRIFQMEYSFGINFQPHGLAAKQRMPYAKRFVRFLFRWVLWAGSGCAANIVWPQVGSSHIYRNRLLLCCFGRFVDLSVVLVVEFSLSLNVTSTVHMRARAVRSKVITNTVLLIAGFWADPQTDGVWYGTRRELCLNAYQAVLNKKKLFYLFLWTLLFVGGLPKLLIFEWDFFFINYKLWLIKIFRVFLFLLLSIISNKFQIADSFWKGGRTGVCYHN